MNKKWTSLGIIFILTLNIITITNLADTSDTQPQVLNFNIQFPDPEIIPNAASDGAHDLVTMKGCEIITGTGQVCVPVKPLRILLPQDKTVDEIKIQSSKQKIHNTLCNIQRGGSLFTITTQTQLNAIKNSNNKYSTEKDKETFYTISGIHTFRGYRVLFLNLYPVHYNELTKQISFYNTMQVTIKTKDISPAGGFRNLKHDESIIKSSIINPEILSTYSKNPTQHTNLDSYQYIIITDEQFINTQTTNSFEDLINSKQNNGITAKIVTKQEILTNPAYHVDGTWGDNNPENPFYQEPVTDAKNKFNDIQAKIRNFIRYAYTELQTEYILLAGDADEIVPEDNLIPCRKLFADEEGLPLRGTLDYEKDDIPSDVYYACLDGNFNDDHDDHYGESKDFNDENQVDEADLLAEVYVGRACVDSIEEMNNFVKKTLMYEENNEPYLNNVLFLGEFLGFPGISAYGGNYKDYIEEKVIFPNRVNISKIYDRNDHWDFLSIYDTLSSGSYHLINHDGHGNHNHLMKTSGDGIRYLTNENPFFIYSHSCLTGSFDNYDCYRGYQEFDCIAEVLTCEIPYGAFACILNARYGLGSENTLESPSGAYDEAFFKALFEENIRELGKASHYSKEQHIWQIDDNGMRWCYYQTNLFGDPALKIKLLNHAPETPTIQGNTQGKIDEMQEYNCYTSDPESDDILYFVDWGDETNTGWIGPYASDETVNIEHTWDEKNTYTIRVKAKDTFGEESDWQTLEVSMPKKLSAARSFLYTKIISAFSEIVYPFL